MAIPVIDMEAMNGEARNEMLSMVHEACAKWGFFWIENHGIGEELMEKVKKLVNLNYEKNMKESFYESDMARGLGSRSPATDPNVDWESSFFVRHRPNSNVDDIPNLDKALREAMNEYGDRVTMIAERLAEAMSENLGLESDYLKKAFSEPSTGTKVAIYPRCPKPEVAMGLRAHTDAGGIILLLQDDTVPGLEFLKDGEWVPITPSKDGRIFVNLGDQLEVVSNGTYKSIRHRVLADGNGSRLSVATFYNPGADAVISPASKLSYPARYSFKAISISMVLRSSGTRSQGSKSSRRPLSRTDVGYKVEQHVFLWSFRKPKKGSI